MHTLLDRQDTMAILLLASVLMTCCLRGEDLGGGAGADVLHKGTLSSNFGRCSTYNSGLVARLHTPAFYCILYLEGGAWEHGYTIVGIKTYLQM